VFKGAGGTLQVHDFNPGEENGLFWTIPVSQRSAHGELHSGKATLTLTDFDMDDYGNVGNALTGGSEIASSSLSVSIRWQGLTNLVHFSNSTLATPFTATELQAVNAGATMPWSAVENGVQFSGNANTADFAMLAEERNGIFFSSKHA
jgi:hypothetical protein